MTKAGTVYFFLNLNQRLRISYLDLFIFWEAMARFMAYPTVQVMEWEAQLPFSYLR